MHSNCRALDSPVDQQRVDDPSYDTTNGERGPPRETPFQYGDDLLRPDTAHEEREQDGTRESDIQCATHEEQKFRPWMQLPVKPSCEGYLNGAQSEECDHPKIELRRSNDRVIRLLDRRLLD
jgi:hypothetical protein